MDNIRNEILADGVCLDLADQATQLVMGAGNPDAEVIFIGEAPGKKEDEIGIPFVGASGKFLDGMLTAVDMNRDDVYITNIVKYRPPDNRDPTTAEKETFSPFLLREIEIVQPKIIVTLGRHSGMFFIPNLVISRDHGKIQSGVFMGKYLQILPLYHPAAALYNGSKRQVLLDDFKAIPAMLAQLF